MSAPLDRRPRASLGVRTVAPIALAVALGVALARYAGAPPSALAIVVAGLVLGAVVARRAIAAVARDLDQTRDALSGLARGEPPPAVVARATSETAALADAANEIVAHVERREEAILRERREFRGALEAVSTAIARAQDTADLYDLTVRETTRILSAASASVLVPRGGDELVVVAVAGVSASRSAGMRVSRGARVVGAQAARESVISRSDDPERPEFAVPILVDGRTEAVLVVEGLALAEDDVPVVNVLARQVAIALGNILSHEEARRDRERYRAVVEYAADGILVRRGKHVVFANRAIREMLGELPLPMLVPEFFDRYVPKEDHAIIEAHYEERLRGQFGRQKYDVHFQRPDGTLTPVQIDGNSITFEGTEASLIFVRDLTELKHAEQELRERNSQLVQAEKLAAIGTLAAGVAHEINNPLAFLRGNVEIMRGDLADLRASLPPGESRAASALASWDETLAVNLAGLDRIAMIVRSLGQFSKPTNDRREVSLNRVAETALLLASTRFKGKRVTVLRDLAPQLPSVSASETQIGQIVLNLLVNAADAMGETGGRIHLRTRVEGPGVVVEVADTGPGIPLETQKRLFSAFFTTKSTGMGLGLSISRTIAEEHGGSLTFESEVGKGTTFRLRLPLVGATLARDGGRARGPTLPLPAGESSS